MKPKPRICICGAEVEYQGFGRPQVRCEKCRGVALKSYHRRKKLRREQNPEQEVVVAN